MLMIKNMVMNRKTNWVRITLSKKHYIALKLSFSEYNTVIKEIKE